MYLNLELSKIYAYLKTFLKLHLQPTPTYPYQANLLGGMGTLRHLGQSLKEDHH